MTPIWGQLRGSGVPQAVSAMEPRESGPDCSELPPFLQKFVSRGSPLHAKGGPKTPGKSDPNSIFHFRGHFSAMERRETCNFCGTTPKKGGSRSPFGAPIAEKMPKKGVILPG